MTADAAGSAEDWRLEITIDRSDGAGGHRLFARLRGDDVAEHLAAVVPGDAVLTHDGDRFFSYAAGHAAVRAVRDAAEGELAREGIPAVSVISRWDDGLDDWRQIDPPPTEADAAVEAAAERDAAAVETRTLVATVGVVARDEFAATVQRAAGDLGLTATAITHPHLLSTQFAFTVTGPRRKIDELAGILGEQGWSSIRADTGVMVSLL